FCALSCEKPLAGPFVAIVERGHDHPFYQRFALPSEQALITQEHPEDTEESMRLKVPENHSLYFVELTPADADKRIVGQIFAYRNTRIAVVPDHVDHVHAYLGNVQWFAERLEFSNPIEPKKPAVQDIKFLS